MSIWPTIPGETPIDPTGLKDKGIRNRDQLNVVEAQNIRKVVVAYLSVKPTRKSAPFCTAVRCLSCTAQPANQSHR
jgi:hypothetical protein